MAGLCSLPGINVECGIAGGVVHTVGNDFISQIAHAVAEAVKQVLVTLTSAWVDIPTPGLSGSGSAAEFVQGHVQYIVGYVAVISLVVAGARMAWHHRSEPAREAFGGLLRLIVVSGAGLATIEFLTTAGDGFSKWILDAATHGAGLHELTKLFVFSTVSGQAGLAPMLTILLGMLAIIGSVIQIGLMFVRSALLVLLGGVWPLSAAAAMTPAGSQWYRKTTGWLLAFILFKPAAAIVYAAAFKLTFATDSATALIEGLLLLMMASLTLPALMRFVVPLTASVGGIGGAEALAAGVGLATGAIAIAATGGGAAAAGGASAAGRGAAALTSGSSTSGGGGGGAVIGGGGGAGPGGPAGDTSPSSPSPPGSSGASGPPGSSGPSGDSPSPESGVASGGSGSDGGSAAGAGTTSNGDGKPGWRASLSGGQQAAQGASGVGQVARKAIEGTDEEGL